MIAFLQIQCRQLRLADQVESGLSSIFAYLGDQELSHYGSCRCRHSPNVGPVQRVYRQSRFARQAHLGHWCRYSLHARDSEAPKRGAHGCGNACTSIAGKGIGRELCIFLTLHGAKVVALSRTESDLISLQKVGEFNELVPT